MVSDSNTINDSIIVYTDGSCDPKRKIGAWVALIFDKEQKTVLEGIEDNTTHQRMELTAVIRSIEYLRAMLEIGRKMRIITDSQYVMGLGTRKTALQAAGFLTKSGFLMRNSDLVQILIGYLSLFTLEFEKVKAHKKVISGTNFNREADLLSRKLVRKHKKSLP